MVVSELILSRFLLFWYSGLTSIVTLQFQNMEVTLIFDRDAFIARNIRGEFHYTYDDIVKVIMTKQDFYILIGESTGFAIEKENCTPEALEFLLELHIEHM